MEQSLFLRERESSEKLCEGCPSSILPFASTSSARNLREKVLEELASHWRRRPPPRQYLLLGIIRVVSDRQFITPRVTTLARSNALLARKPVVGTHIVQQAGTKIARSAK